MIMTNTNSTKALYHEIKKLSNGKRKLHIYAYGFDLTKGQRTLTDRNLDIIKEDVDFIDLLNEKAEAAVASDPHWLIDSLSDWRSWAISFISEFYDMQNKQMAIDIRKAQAKAIGEDYHE